MEKKILYARQNEAWHLKLYDDNTVDIVDLSDGETINIKAEKLPSIKPLVDSLEQFLKGVN